MTPECPTPSLGWLWAGMLVGGMLLGGFYIGIVDWLNARERRREAQR